MFIVFSFAFSTVGCVWVDMLMFSLHSARFQCFLFVALISACASGGKTEEAIDVPMAQSYCVVLKGAYA